MLKNGNHKTEGKIIWTIIPPTSSNALKRMRMDEGKKVLNQGKKAKISENKKDLKL